MNFMELLLRLEKYHCDIDLEDIDISCNKINNVALLIFKNTNTNVIFDAMVLNGDVKANLPKENKK